MAYVKTDWKARQGRNLNKFTKYQETGNTVILENTPDSITEPGTSFNVERMKKIEQGIYDEHELVAAEEQGRKADIISLKEKTINIIGKPNGIASLDEQAKVPLEQLPDVFSEDFTDVINAVNMVESNILNRLFPIGSGYTQGINDPTPIEAGLPGIWQKWTGKAEAYRLMTGTLPSYTTYTAGANYAANAYVLWHLPSAGYEIFKAKAAITNAAVQLDPVLWEKYTTGTIVERRLLQGWLDNDLSIGNVISGGSYNGQRVSEVIVRGGTFPSWEGGNRPTFKTGGIDLDRIYFTPHSLLPNTKRPPTRRSYPSKS